MVRGIDGGFLINMLRAGREDGLQARQMRAQEEAAKQKASVLGRLYTGGEADQGGVAGNYAPSRPAREPSFGEAFGADTMQAMETGQALPALPAQQPEQVQEAPRRPERQSLNPQAFHELLTIDPEMATQIATGLQKFDEAQLKQFSAKNDFMGGAARYVQAGRTPEERMHRFEIARDHLREVGWSDQELDGVERDLSDERLQFYQATAIDYDKLIDNALAEREFQAGKNVPVVPGGNVANIKPDGSASWVIGGGASQDIPTVSNADDYARIAPGSQYRDPDGNLRTKPGGGASNGTGSFPQ